MKAFTIDFTRAEKSPAIMERKLNAALAQGQFKGASQSESAATGRVTYTVLINEAEASKAKVRIFRETSLADLDRKLNEFVKQSNVRIVNMLQSSSVKSNNLLLTLFYSDGPVQPVKKGGKGGDTKGTDTELTTEETQSGTGQDGTSSQNPQS